jgi:hypothetical protein
VSLTENPSKKQKPRKLKHLSDELIGLKNRITV